jgi:phosphoribosylcarboxyaminoimidazole (NCAIR) mutase
MNLVHINHDSGLYEQIIMGSKSDSKVISEEVTWYGNLDF